MSPSTCQSERAEDEQTCTERKKKKLNPDSPVAFLSLSPSLEKTGSYEGDSDLQLERVNVYFNEATGG